MKSLHPDQKEALAFLGNHDRAILGDAPGAGKTAIGAIWAAEHGIAVVVTPKLGGAGPAHWVAEIQEWLGDSVAWAQVGGTKLQREDSWSLLLDEPLTGPTIVVLTYEVLKSDLDRILALHPTAVVFDEAHRLKGRSTQVTKAAKKVAHSAKAVLLMTGTPVKNMAGDLWQLLNLVDPKNHRSYWRWAHEHCYVETKHYGGSGRGVSRVGDLRPGHDVILKHGLRDVMIQRTPQEIAAARGNHFDEPVHTVWPVDLSKAERDLYKQISDNYFAQLDNLERPLMAVNEVSKINLLRQISSDWSRLVDSGTPGSKVKTTVEIIEDIGEPVLVMAQYRSTVATLAHELGAAGYDVSTYTGESSHADRMQALADFGKGGTRRVLVGTIDALGEGVDGLQHVARHLILLDRSWSPSGNTQAIGRLARTGQDKPVIVHHIVATNSTDQRVAEALARKEELQTALHLAYN